MIVAAAACAAAGISYIFNDVQSMTKDQSETVTASSTIVDPQGVSKYVIYPSRRFPPLSMVYAEERQMRRCQSKQLRLPVDPHRKMYDLKREFSMVFFWSIPLNTRLFQTPTNSAVLMENSHCFEYYSMKISIGTQSGMDENLPSEIALSHSNETLDSLSSMKDSLIPMGILKKNKSDLDEREIHGKRFCLGRETTEERLMKNVKLCVENLSKILTESSSNTVQNSSSLRSITLNHQVNIDRRKESKLFFKDRFDCLTDGDGTAKNHFYLHDEKSPSDGIILHRGEQFGLALGEPMIRKLNLNDNLSIYSFHSIHEFNRLFSHSTRQLMQQHQIKSIEDLIRLYFHHGKDDFTNLMLHFFRVDSNIVRQLNVTLLNWTQQLT